MKITILDIKPQEEEEVIIKCHEMDDNLRSLIQKLKNGNQKITGYLDNNEKIIISRQYVNVLKERLGL